MDYNDQEMGIFKVCFKMLELNIKEFTMDFRFKGKCWG